MSRRPAHDDDAEGYDDLLGDNDRRAANSSHQPNDTKTKKHKTDPAAKEAVDFLKKLRPAGPWVLTGIIPDGLTDTITTRDVDEVCAFVAANNGIKNLYYSVNPTRREMTSKAAKTDIAAIEFFLADLDPKEGETSEAAKARYAIALETHEPRPAAVVDSGNGIQVLWRLAEPIELAEPIMGNGKDGKPKKEFTQETAAVIADVEGRIATVMKTLDSVAGTQNVDRILRLPGTTNLPTKAKVKHGRVACQTKLIKFNGATCTLDDFPTPAAKDPGAGNDNTTKSGASLDWAKVDEHAGWLKTDADLPSDFKIKGRIIVNHKGRLDDLNFDLKQGGVVEKPYGSWSDVGMALAAVFKADGRFTLEQIAAALLCDIECNRHVTRQADKRRAVERLLSRSHEPPAASRFVRGALNWRERRANGSPLPTMYNARLAIEALNIECSYDTFHNKLLIGFKRDDVRHEVEVKSLVGDVTDDALIMLRQIISDKFGVDLEDKAVRDGVKSLALQNCFNPVMDMLAKAEAEWDGIERIDGMAVDYFNAEDTPLNRAMVRKTMIAGVRRVRKPGCKFDNILTLESPEGWMKSSALEELAGKENFSDEKIIGKESREVQEQLAGIWIHENAELAGMRKTDVDSVKTFASRKTDRARPVWGHFQKDQLRHSIEVGTTNNDRYLQSQTGNRRFWPLRVLSSIDIAKLERDRLQLWGEAARLETAGESLVLDEKLWPAAGEEQEKRRVLDPWEDTLEFIPPNIPKYNPDKPDEVVGRIDIIHDVDDQRRVATADLLEYVLKIPKGMQDTRHTMRLATIMKILGWQRTSNGKVSINGQQLRGYFKWYDESKRD
jgi:predicted P-loop ATPase